VAPLLEEQSVHALRNHDHRDKQIPANGVGEKRADPNFNFDAVGPIF
jgi:hypothetical protein